MGKRYKSDIKSKTQRSVRPLSRDFFQVLYVFMLFCLQVSAAVSLKRGEGNLHQILHKVETSITSGKWESPPPYLYSMNIFWSELDPFKTAPSHHFTVYFWAHQKKDKRWQAYIAPQWCHETALNRAWFEASVSCENCACHMAGLVIQPKAKATALTVDLLREVFWPNNCLWRNLWETE